MIFISCNQNNIIFRVCVWYNLVNFLTKGHVASSKLIPLYKRINNAFSTPCERITSVVSSVSSSTALTGVHPLSSSSWTISILWIIGPRVATFIPFQAVHLRYWLHGWRRSRILPNQPFLYSIKSCSLILLISSMIMVVAPLSSRLPLSGVSPSFSGVRGLPKWITLFANVCFCCLQLWCRQAQQAPASAVQQEHIRCGDA